MLKKSFEVFTAATAYGELPRNEGGLDQIQNATRQNKDFLLREKKSGQG